MKHTKGPWKFEQHEVKTGPYSSSAFEIWNQNTHIATIHEHVDRKDDTANARLIAAAPELLQIAEAYRNLLKTMAHTDGEVATYHHIQNVIAKARGES